MISGTISDIFTQMKLNVPYYSQHTDVKDEFWQKRACGIVCLKMVLDFYGVRTLEPDDFIKSAVEKNAFRKSGWRHNKLVEIATDFGLKADRKEFKFANPNNLICGGSTSTGCEHCLLTERGVDYLAGFLTQRRLVIVSVVKKFKYLEKFHQVVLTGFEVGANERLEGFYYNDPDYQNEKEGKNLFVPLDIFQKYWRGLAIFISV